MRFHRGSILLSALVVLVFAGRAPAQPPGKPTPPAADIITGAGAGGGPHVKVFDGNTGAIKSRSDAATGKPKSRSNALVPAVQKVRESSARIQSQNLPTPPPKN